MIPMKRIVFFFFPLFSFLFLFSSPFAFGASQTIYQNYVHEEEIVEIDGINYTAYYHRDYDARRNYTSAVRFSSNPYGTLVLLKDISYTARPYTFLMSTLLKTNNTYSYYITVTKEYPEISVTRSFSPEKIKLNQEAEITTTIDNTGEDMVFLTFREELPTYTVLTEIPTMTKGTSTQQLDEEDERTDIYWSGPLYDNESVIIFYIIKPTYYPPLMNNLSLDSAKIAYEDDYGTYEEDVKAINISLYLPLEIEVEQQSSEEITVGNEIEYFVTVKNYGEEQISVSSFNITAPDFFETVLIAEDDTESQDVHPWSGTIDERKNVSFSLFVTPRKIDKQNIELQINYSYLGKNYLTTKNQSIDVTYANVTPLIDIETASFTPEKYMEVRYFLNNSGTGIFENEILNITSDLFEPLHYRISIPAMKKKLILIQNITFPYSEENKNYTITLMGTYGGKEYVLSRTITVYTNISSSSSTENSTFVEDIEDNEEENGELNSTSSGEPFAVTSTTNSLTALQNDISTLTNTTVNATGGESSAEKEKRNYFHPLFITSIILFFIGIGFCCAYFYKQRKIKKLIRLH